MGDIWDLVESVNKDREREAVRKVLNEIEEEIGGAVIEMRMQGAYDKFDKGYIQGLYRAIDIIKDVGRKYI